MAKTKAQNNNYSEVLSVTEVAQIFRITPESIRSMIRNKKLPAIKFGSHYRIPKWVIDQYFENITPPSLEQYGFGIWKNKEEFKDSIEYVNKLRIANKCKSDGTEKTDKEFLEEIKTWQKKKF